MDEMHLECEEDQEALLHLYMSHWESRAHRALMSWNENTSVVITMRQ